MHISYIQTLMLVLSKVLKRMVAERFTPSPGDAPPGPDSALNKIRLRIPVSMALDSAISNTGVRTNIKSRNPDYAIPDSGL